MFNKKEEPVRRRRSGVGIIRLFLSLIIIVFLGFGLYLAVKNFSGYDPLKLNPSSIEKAVFGSDLVYKTVNGLLSIGPPGSFQGIKDRLKNGINQTSNSKPSESSKPMANLKYKFGNRHFWAEGYYVSTVGLNEATIKKYIQEQEKHDIALDKLSVKEYENPFRDNGK